MYVSNLKNIDLEKSVAIDNFIDLLFIYLFIYFFFFLKNT